MPTTKKTRSVKYEKPGLTVVSYKHRTLNIRFKESKKDYEAKVKAVNKAKRRSAAKKAAKTREATRSDIRVIRDSSGNMRYVDAKGRDASRRAAKYMSDYKDETIRQGLARDRYTLEDMRAMLTDDHWEEVCGHKRWKYDNKSLIREFNKYINRRRKK